MAAVLRRPALRACITPKEGDVPRELLLATIALAASGTVAGVPLQELREGIVVELDLSRRGLGPSGAELIGMLLPVNASLTKVLVSGNRLGDAGTTILCDALRGSTVSKVQELGLSSNGIGPDGAKAVAALCAAMASLTLVR